MIEHRAVPGAADRKRNRSDQARPRACDETRRGGCGADSTDADKGTHDMAQIVRIDRNDLAEGNGDNVEQAAIEIQVLEMEYALVCEMAFVAGDYQFAVVMLNTFVIGNGIVPERAKSGDGQRTKQQHSGDVMRIETRHPLH